MDYISTDILGPLPLTSRNNVYILVATDHFSKLTEVYALPDQTAATEANTVLNEIFSKIGLPLSIHSDQGRNYESQLFTELCQMLEIRKTRSSVAHPMSNGQCERFNRTMLWMIKAYLKGEQRDWDKHLGCPAGAYHSTVQESTGLTPNMMMLGREV